MATKVTSTLYPLGGYARATRVVCRLATQQKADGRRIGLPIVSIPITDKVSGPWNIVSSIIKPLVDVHSYLQIGAEVLEIFYRQTA